MAERPQKFIPDGQEYSVPDFPGLKAVAARLDSNTVQVEVIGEDGSTVGQGTYAVSADGKLLTATTSGFDKQLRRFETRTVWDRS